jgi:[CysO sulfur-carrier protein]-S-L-cysteine hydrolase
MENQKIIIPRALWQAMREQVSREAPLESCGLLAGCNGRAQAIYPVSNVLASPVRFRMAPYEQLQAFEAIENAGLELLGIYHSHPGGPAIPSETDLQEARYAVVNLIWSPREGTWSARAFWLETSAASEIAIEIEEEQLP